MDDKRQQNCRKSSIAKNDVPSFSTVTTQTSPAKVKTIQTETESDITRGNTTRNGHENSKRSGNFDKSTVAKLKAELECAKAKIKKLEEENLEAAKRRSIEIEPKFGPTPCTR